MITINVESKEYGNSKQYIAHITGRAAKFTFERNFVGRRSDRFTSYSTDEAGLYENCDINRKGQKECGYLVVATAPDGELVKMRSNLDEAMEIAKRMDAGEALESMIEIVGKEGAGWTYTLRTKSEAKAAISGQTIDSATEACWQIMQALPEREAKKVLAALKLRVSPPKPAQPELAEAVHESGI